MIAKIQTFLVWTLIQSLVIQFCLNQSIVLRFGMERFTYPEVFMMVAAIMTLAYNFASNSTDSKLGEIRNSIELLTTINYSMLFAIFKEMTDHNGTTMVPQQPYQTCSRYQH